MQTLSSPKLATYVTFPPVKDLDEGEPVSFPSDLQNLVNYRGIKVIHQNIQSLTRKIDELRFICKSLDSKIHLLTFSETWFDGEISDSEINIPGYTVFRMDRESKDGGVAVYARNDISVIRRTDLEIEGVEGLWLELILPKSRDFLSVLFIDPPIPQNITIKIFCPSWILFSMLLQYFEKKWC